MIGIEGGWASGRVGCCEKQLEENRQRTVCNFRTHGRLAAERSESATAPTPTARAPLPTLASTLLQSATGPHQQQAAEGTAGRDFPDQSLIATAVIGRPHYGRTTGEWRRVRHWPVAGPGEWSMSCFSASSLDGCLSHGAPSRIRPKHSPLQPHGTFSSLSLPVLFLLPHP